MIENKNFIDCLKLFMAFVVVAIHTEPLINFPKGFLFDLYSSFTRLAVPFFFLSTGYLLAKKTKCATNDVRENTWIDANILKKYLYKVVKMYFAWMCVYTPLSIYHSVVTHVSLLKMVGSFVRGLALVGEQYNSYPLWYLLSTIYALLVLLFFEKKMVPNSVRFVIVLSVALVSFSFRLYPFDETFFDGLKYLNLFIKYCVPEGRILSGLVYIPLGVFLANHVMLKRLSFFLFVCFYFLGALSQNAFVNACLLTVSVATFFKWAEGISLKNHQVYSYLRQISILVYFLHMYVWSFYYWIVYGEKTFGVDSFLITTLISLLLSLGWIVVKKKISF